MGGVRGALQGWREGGVSDGVIEHACSFGKVTFVNQDSFQGQFQNDDAEGLGIYQYASGQVVKGQWSQKKYSDFLE